MYAQLVASWLRLVFCVIVMSLGGLKRPGTTKRDEITLSISTALTVSVSHLPKLSSNQDRTASISEVHKGGRIMLRPGIGSSGTRLSCSSVTSICGGVGGSGEGERGIGCLSVLTFTKFPYSSVDIARTSDKGGTPTTERSTERSLGLTWTIESANQTCP